MIQYFIIFFVFMILCFTLQTQWLDAYIPDFKVNDDNLNSYQTNSQIGVDTAGNFVIVWYDVRAYPGNQYPSRVYCQRYNKTGLALGNNFTIGQDTSYSPRITMLSDGRFIVLWGHSFIQSIQNYELYFQRFDSKGSELDIAKRVIDTSFIAATNLLAGIDISSDSSGNFVICWCLKPNINSSPFVYFQRFDSSGSRIGAIETVNENFGYAQFPSVASNKDGSFVIVWQDDRHPTESAYDIYMQRYNASGVKLGNNVKVNDDATLQLFRGGAKVSTNGYGQTVVTWLDPRICGFGEIFYQIFQANGSILGINRKANNSPCGDNVNSGVVSMRNDRFFYIGWSEWFYSGREQFYGRRFDSLGNAIGNSYMIPSFSNSPTTQRANSVFLLGDRVYSTWHHNLNTGVNIDIYSNVRGFQNPDTVIGITNTGTIVKEYKLYPSFPNPFNPVSLIKFDIPKESNVNIKIYDIVGREVKTLINETRQPGSYEISFDGSNYASGVYVYRIVAGNFTDVKKMVLLK